MDKPRTLPTHHPGLPFWLGWLESALLAAALVLIVLSASGQVDQIAISSGLLFSGLLSAVFGALRTRLPRSPWARQLWFEALQAAAYIILIPCLIAIAVQVSGAYPLLEASSTGVSGWTSLFIVGFGELAYPITRLLRRLWDRWDDLQQRRITLSITQAILSVTLLVALLVILVFTVRTASETIIPIAEQADASLFARLVNRTVTVVLPVLSSFLVWSLAALVVLAPLSALFAYRVARRTTRRLEDLARAAGALADGAAHARVDVTGRDEVAALQARFNDMAERLEQARQALETERNTVTDLLESRRRLFANISHELRTPVATIEAYLDSLQRASHGASPPTWAHDLEVIQTETGYLKRLLDDLFVLARTDLDRLELASHPVDVCKTVQQVAGAFAPYAWQSGGIEIVQEIPKEALVILADEVRLAQVLGNLVKNAIRHTRPGGLVGVFARAEGGSAVIEVRDTGSGMREDEVEHIWEPFFQGSGERSADTAGLGLALIKELTERMGGSVSASTVEGEGSCFTVRFPT